MGIFDALTTAVSGLQAQSFALQNISGNIANASTTGYKGTNTSFEDLIPGANSPAQQVAGGVIASSQATITSQGTVTASTVATNVAINGDGFFSVQKPTGIVDNVPTFSGIADYTRSGDFQLNSNGNLVNGAGYYLMGQTVDAQTGNVTGNVPQVLQFQSSFIPAQSTSSITYAANLPSTPTTKNSAGSTAGSIQALGGLSAGDFQQSPLITGSPQALLNVSQQGSSAVSNLSSPAVTTSATTLLSGSAPANALTHAFASGDSLNVDGTVINFSASSPTSSGITSPININTGDTLGTLLAKIDAITGTLTPSTIDSSGKITLQTGTTTNLVITPSAGTAATAFQNLGFTLTSGTLTVNANPTGTAGTGTVIASDQTNFLAESVSGSAVTTYDQTGNPVNLQLRWALVDSAQLGGPGHQNTWNLFYESNPSATGSQVQWTNAGTNFTFNSSGTMTSPTSPVVTIPGVKVGSLTLGNVALNLTQGGQNALTQYASGGAVSINSTSQNGYAAGSLQSVAINNNGLVVGTFSNGQNLDLASVTLSHFSGTNYLQALNGGAYAATEQSGSAIIGASGTISGSSLEGSNTDIATEFAKLIVTQQAYSADTKIVTTANSMVQDLLNVLR